MARKVKIVIGFEGEPASAAEVAAELRGLADTLSPPASGAKPPKTTKAKPVKEEEELDEDETEEEETEEEEESSEDSEEAEADDETEEEESEEDDEPKAPSKKDCLAALKNYGAKHKKSKAIAVMKATTGCDSIHDVPAKKYAKLLAALKK